MPPADPHRGQDLAHGLLDLLLLARHVVAGELAQQSSTASCWCRMSICCPAIVCSAISVSWSAIARLSLAAWARLALTWSETMIDSCGRLRIVSSSGQGTLSKPIDRAEDQPGHDPDRDEQEDVHRAAEEVDPVRDLVQDAGPADVLGQHELGMVLLRALLDLRDLAVQLV